MDNLIPTATIILAEASVVLLVLLTILGVRYVRRNRQHRREIETLMDMARDSRISLPGPKNAGATPVTIPADRGSQPSTPAPAAVPAGAGTTLDEAATSRARQHATQVDPHPKDATGDSPAAAAGDPARAPATAPAESAVLASAPVHDPEPALAPGRDPAEAAATAAPVTDGQDVETLRRAVTALEAKVLQAHRDHVRLAARMQRAMDQVAGDVAAARRELAELADRLLNGPARAPHTAASESRDEVPFPTDAIRPAPAVPTDDLFEAGPPAAESPESPAPVPTTAPRSGVAAPSVRAPAPLSPPEPTAQEEQVSTPGEDADDSDSRWIHASTGPGETPAIGQTTAADAEPTAAEDPDYILDSETIERLLGADGMAASAQDSGIDVEEISLSESGPQWNPAPARQPFASQQDNIFFQSSTAGGLEQGWYISLAGEPPQGPFSDKQTAERVLHEVRGHTAGRSARSG